MDNERYDNIEYEENWQNVPVTRAEPFNNEEDEYFSDYDENEDISGGEDAYTKNISFFKRKEGALPQPVIKLQLILSVIVILGLFLMKSLGGDFYASAKKWYFENLNKSLVIDFQEINLG